MLPSFLGRRTSRRGKVLAWLHHPKYDPRLYLAASAVAESLEDRCLLTALPAFVQGDSGSTYTLSGTAGNYNLDFTSGDWVVTAPFSSAGSDWNAPNISISTTSHVTFESQETLSTLTLADGAHLALGVQNDGAGIMNGGAAPIGNALVITGTGGTVGGLTMPSDATLDLGDNNLIVQNTDSTGLQTAQGLIYDAYNVTQPVDIPTWANPGAPGGGTGITSSTAAAAAAGATPMTLLPTLGDPPAFSATPSGVTIGSSTLLVMYTPFGDTNFDAAVDLTDYRAFKSTYGSSIGDANYIPALDINHDGNIDLTDYRFFKASYGTNLGGAWDRTLSVTGLSLQLTEGNFFSGVVADFSDSLQLDPSDYLAFVDWGNGNFVPETVTGEPGNYQIITSNSVQIKNTHALMTALVEYTADSGFDGYWPDSLSTPITATPAVQNLTATSSTGSGQSASEVDLAWTANATLMAGSGDDYVIERSTNATTGWADIGTSTTPSFDDTSVSPGTQYYYQVYASLSGYSSQMSNIASATAVEPAPAQLTAASITSDSVLLTWQPPIDTAAAASYVIDRNGTEIATTVGTAYQDTSLTPGTSYSYLIYAVGTAGDTSAAATLAVTTVGGTTFAATSPTTPGSLSAANITQSSLTLSWGASTSSNGSVTYEIMRNNVVVGSSTSTSFTDSGLTPSTAYAYAVTAYDSVFNESQAATNSFTTGADTTQPLPPTNLIATGNTGTSISLAWSPGSDNISVTQYRVYRDGSLLAGSVTGLSYTDSTTTPGTQYAYQVASVDGAGNVSYLPTPPDPTDYVQVTANAAAPEENVTEDQYIPPGWQNYFYNSLMPAMRELYWNINGTVPDGQGWFDQESDTAILGNSIVAGLPMAANVWYYDSNGNGEYDPGETVWTASLAFYNSSGDADYDPSAPGFQRLAGPALPTGTGASVTNPLGLTYNGFLLADPDYYDGQPTASELSKIIYAPDPAMIEGVQGQLAYIDLKGDGHWDAGDPIWHDAENDNEYDGTLVDGSPMDAVIYNPNDVPLTTGEYGKRNGLNFYDFNGTGQWAPNDTLTWIDYNATFQQDFAATYQDLEYFDEGAGRTELDPNLVNSLGDILASIGTTPMQLPGDQTFSAQLDSQGRISNVTGNNTQFESAVAPGDFLEVDNRWLEINSVISNTQLTVADSDNVTTPVSDGAVNLMNFVLVPNTTVASTPSSYTTTFNYTLGIPTATSLIFPQQFQQLHDLLSAIQWANTSTIPQPPSTPLPIVSQMASTNVVQDSNLDGVVQVDHDQTTFGMDTGSISFEANRDMPQVYIPLNTDGTDQGDALPIHEYLVQGGFGTSSSDIGTLLDPQWTYADANPNGQPYAYSLDTHVDINLLVNDAANHIKRIEVIRPTGNAVVFDFPWDASANEFGPIGTPIGIDASRVYVLRALYPSNDNSLSYEMLFPSGIVQKFAVNPLGNPSVGVLISVSNSSSGMSQNIPSFATGMTFDATTGDPDIEGSTRYTLALNWNDGTISSVDYTTNTSVANAPTSAATIETTLGYAGGGSNDILSLNKTQGTAASGSTTPIPQFSYSFTDNEIPSITFAGGTISRSGSFEGTGGAGTSGGTVTLTTTLTGAAGSSSEAVAFNSYGLVVSDTNSLTEGTGPASSSATSYAYSLDAEDTENATNRFNNGAPIWGKVTQVSYADGSWETFSYDPATGWVTHDTTPFKNSGASNGPGSGTQDTAYGYDATQSGKGLAADPTLLVERPRVTTTSVQGIVTGITYSDYHSIGGLTVETRQAASNTGSTWANAQLDTTTTLTGYNSYTVQQGAASVSYTSTALGDNSIVKWGNTTLSSGSDTYNPFGYMVSSASSGLGQTPVSTSGTPSTDSFGRVTQSATITGGLTSSASGFNWSGPTTVTGPDHVPTTYTYTPLGQVLTATALGVTTTYGRDAAGNIISTMSVGAAGNNGSGNSAITTTSSGTFDSMGRPTSSTDAMGNKTTFAYNDTAHTVTTTYNATGSTSPTSSSSPSGTEVDSYYLDGALQGIAGTAVTPSTYNEGVSSNGDTWSASSIDGGNTWSQSFSNMLGQAYQQTAPTPAARVSSGGPTTATATTHFDGNGRPDSYTGFDGSITQTVYDPATGVAGATIVKSDTGDRKTTYQYTTATTSSTAWSGETITDLSSSGNVVTTYQSKNGGLNSQEIDNGATTSTDIEIDSDRGAAIVTTTSPDGTKIVDTYAGDLLRSEVQKGTDNSTVTSQTFGYDSLNRDTSITDPVFGTTSQTLRLDGSVSATTLPGHSAATVNSADASTEAPTASTRSDGQTQSQNVNAMGQVTSQSGAGLIASSFGYDTGTGQLNDLKLYPSGNTSSSTYQETKWEFDPATGAQTSMTYAGSGSGTDTINYKYNGAQLGQIAGEGVTTALGYNTAGEQNKTTVDDGSQTVTTNVTSQDDQGNPTSISISTKNDGVGGAVTSSATDSFTYQNGNLANEIQSFVGVTTHSDYYPATGGGTGSSPKALKDVILIQNGVATSSTAYQYDSVSGRLQTIWVNSQLPGGMTLAALQASPSTLFSGSYFGVGYLANSNLVNAISAGGAQTAWNYFPSGSGSATGDLSSVITTTQNGTTTLDSNTYTYNTNDQMQTATVAQATNTSSINYTQTYGYDAMDELNSVEGSGDSNSYSYTYDGVGNRTGNSTLGSANSLNEFADNFTYNARGDVTNDGTYAYTWNAADQLTAVVANNTSIKDTFQYDGENRQIEKDVYYYEGGTWQLQYARKFVYAGTNLVGELDGNGNEVTGYTWGPQGLMAVTDYAGSTPTVYLAMLDGQGNVVGLANGSNGVVAASFTYDPYGALLSATGPAANVCNVLYKQGYTDREVGLNYFKARYEKWVGIWLSRDPEGIAGGSNVFEYCNNDPINYLDPVGATPLPNETAESCVQCHGTPSQVQLFSLQGFAAPAYGTDTFGRYFFQQGATKYYPTIICHGRDANGPLPGLTGTESYIDGIWYRSGNSADVIQNYVAGLARSLTDLLVQTVKMVPGGSLDVLAVRKFASRADASWDDDSRIGIFVQDALKSDNPLVTNSKIVMSGRVGGFVLPMLVDPGSLVGSGSSAERSLAAGISEYRGFSALRNLDYPLPSSDIGNTGLVRSMTPWQRSVVERPSVIDWNLIRPKGVPKAGLTNLQAAEIGWAPGRINPATGKWDPMVLHHLLDDPRGTVMQTWLSDHSAFHQMIGREPNLWRLSNPRWAEVWGDEVSGYWRWRTGAYNPPPQPKLWLPGDPK